MKNIILSVIICTLYISFRFVKIEAIEKLELIRPDDLFIISPDINYVDINDSTQVCISGIVLDENNNGIPFVNIVLIGTEIGDQSNEVGKFKICNIDSGFYDLKMNKIGFRSTLIKNLKIEITKSVIIDSIVMQIDPLLEEIERVIEMKAGKPIIYLYPKAITNVQVQLDFNGKLTHTYPKYENSWKVEAHPEGTLFDEDGKEYYALYWEGNFNNQFIVNEGFVIPGEETIKFLEKALEQLGLNRKEANEFIIYWLPKLENNPYNLIHFSATEYEEMAKLNIKPSPDTIIRVMMIYQPLDKPILIKEQELPTLKKNREGFTVVEWGGCLLQ